MIKEIIKNMRAYSAEKYQKLVEDSDDKTLHEFMEKEFKLIAAINDKKNKLFIDLASGYGRVLPIISKFANHLITIEFHPNMLPELKRRCSLYDNCSVIEGDITKLSDVLKEDLDNPVFLLLQNTIGTIEGDWKSVINSVKEKLVGGGELIISFFRQEALKPWGIKMYAEIADMVGTPDQLKTDFEKGQFVSRTGYTSKWWKKAEILEIVKTLDAKIVDEIWEKEFCILHLKV